MLAIAGLQNRGLHIEAEPNHIGVTLEPNKQSTLPLSTYSDASPIVTAPDARVITSVKGPTKPTHSEAPMMSGMSTRGSASPIVTGQGAVVTSTVDNRP